MTLIVFSIPVMILAVAVAVVPLVVLSHRDHKERLLLAAVHAGAQSAHAEGTRTVDAPGSTDADATSAATHTAAGDSDSSRQDQLDAA